MSAIAQTDVHNNGQIYILSSTDTVYITGTLNNANTAVLRNTGGNLYVLKNLNNDEANMQPGGGKLWFTGSQLQNITGTQPVRTHNWIVDNVAGVNLQNRIGIGNGTGGTMSFVRGLVSSGTNTQDVYFYPASNYTGFSDAAHIIGYCTKSGTGDFTFPIGNGTLKADLDIANLISPTDFQCKYFGTGYGIYIPLSPLVSVFEKEYWTLDRITGASQANITLKWNDARKPLNHTLPSDLRLGHFTAGNWISEGGTGSGNTNTGTLTSANVNSFSPFTFASVGVALPLKISDYTVISDNSCRVNISWNAFDETSVSLYVIQRTADQTTWEDASSILVNENLATTANHFSLDDKAEPGTWMYRIKIVNKDGSFAYTGMRIVHLHCGSNQVHLYPTITNDLITVTTSNDTRLKSISICNLSGQIITKQHYSGVTKALLRVNQFISGVYSITVVTNDGINTFKIIKTD